MQSYTQKQLRQISKQSAALVFSFCLAFTSICTPIQSAIAADDAAAAAQKAATQQASDVAAKAAQDKAQKAIDDQKAAMQGASDTSNQGMGMSTMLGLGLMAAGAIMIVIGTGEDPPNEPLTYAGIFTVAGGMGAMMAGAAMGGNANKGTQNAGGLDSIGNLGGGFGTSTNTDGFKANTGDGGTGTIAGGTGTNTGASDLSRIKLDPEGLRAGKIGEIFDKFEAATGLSRDDFAKGALSGVNPADLLAGKTGMSTDSLRKAIDDAAKKGSSGGAGGISSADIEKLAKDSGLADLYAASKDGGVDFSGGGSGASRAPASGAAAEKFDFSKLADSGSAASETGKNIDLAQMSEQVRKQLEKEGRTGLSLFQLVSNRYKKMTPMLFGEMRALGSVDEKPKQSLDNENI